MRSTASLLFQTHNKVYGSEGEELSRHIIWEAKKKYIDEHNAHQKGFGFTLAINKFSDLVRPSIAP